MQGNEEYAVKVWGEGLTNISGEQIKRGLNALTGEWPPSMPEFKELCLNGVKSGLGLDYRPPYHTEFTPEKRLESDTIKTKRKKAAKLAFTNIHKIMKKT